MKIDISRLRAPWGHEVTVRGTTIAVLAPVDADCFGMIDERDPAQVRSFVGRIFPEPVRGMAETISDGEAFTIAHIYGQWSAQYFADIRRAVAAVQASERGSAQGAPDGEAVPPPARPRGLATPSQGEGDVGDATFKMPPRGEAAKKAWGETSGVGG